MLIFLSIALMLIAGVLLAALPKQRWLRILITILSLFLVMAEFTSVMYGNGYVDYQFYVNMNLDNMISGFLIFTSQVLMVSAAFIVIIFLLYRLSLALHHRVSRFWLALVCLLSWGALAIPTHGPLSKLHETYDILTTKETDFDRALSRLGISSTEYVHKSDIVAEKGKNIVVISLESLEQGFMSPAFEQLMPNLSALAKEYTYFNQMPVGPGSAWTVASMYTYMTGVPFWVGGYQTNPFHGTKSTQLVNLGHVLHQAGYNTVYTLGMPDFAGMGDANKLFGISVVSEKTYPNRYPEAPFGLYDKDAFDLAKHELDALATQDKPFALFLSTVSTHAPHGFVDERMKGIVADREDSFEFSVASLDYNLGQFVSYLRENGWLENTVFYIFPDHNVMGYGTDVVKKLSTEPRQLYMITNAAADTLGRSPNDKIYQIDLPRLILNGAEIKTNARFLTDFIQESDKIQYIYANRKGIAAVNAAAMKP